MTFFTNFKVVNINQHHKGKFDNFFFNINPSRPHLFPLFWGIKNVGFAFSKKINKMWGLEPYYYCPSKFPKNSLF